MRKPIDELLADEKRDLLREMAGRKSIGELIAEEEAAAVQRYFQSLVVKLKGPI